MCIVYAEYFRDNDTSEGEVEEIGIWKQRETFARDNIEAKTYVLQT